MANILDYIKWRGDLSILQDGFNEIDSLILSRFSYLPFDNIIKENEVVTIRELSERLKKEGIANATIVLKSYKLLDQESKKMILETLTGLIRVAKDNFFEKHNRIKK